MDTFRNIWYCITIWPHNIEKHVRDACKKDNEYKAKWMIDNGVDINDYELSWVGKACAYNATKTLKMLLHHGADPNLHNFLLGLCYRGDNVECMKLLLEYGADPNRHDSVGFTPLSAYCWYGKKGPEPAQLLLDYGANPNRYRRGCGSPLFYACRTRRHNNIDIAKVLIRGGADVNYKDSNGDTIFNHLTEHQTHIIQNFIKEINVEKMTTFLAASQFDP